MIQPQPDESQLLSRISVNPAIFGGKPIVRGRRLAVEHVLSMLAAGDSPQTILEGYPWLEPDDIRACLEYARRLVAHERIEPAIDPGRGAAARRSCWIPASGVAPQLSSAPKVMTSSGPETGRPTRATMRSSVEPVMKGER